MTGLLGPNGAGKTTLLHMTAGLLAPSAGQVRVGGQHAWRNPDIYRRVGLVPERESRLPVPHRPRVRARQRQAPRARATRTPPPRGPSTWSTSRTPPTAASGTYSKGMRQRIKMAAALVHDPPVLILDEPFNGMDPRQRLHMFELLHRMADEGRTVLLSSHILEEVERIAASVLVIYAGRLAASGDFRSIRRLMTDRPHEFFVRSSDDRRLGSMLLAEESVFGVELDAKGLLVRTSDFGRFTRQLPRIAARTGIRCWS